MTHVVNQTKPKFIYGKGRSSGKRLAQVRKNFLHLGELKKEALSHPSGKIIKKRGVGLPSRILASDNGIWANEHTSLSRLERRLAFPLLSQVKSLAKRKKVPVVVDWGAGSGKAITTLAKIVPSIKAYGFSKHSYKQWLENKRVKFIHGEEKDFRRYFKKGTVDILYSHLGILHQDRKIKEYLNSILPVLSVGGILVTDVPYDVFTHGKSIVKREGMSFELDFKEKPEVDGQTEFLSPNILVARRIS